MHILYAPDFPAQKVLPKEESRHIIKVLRSKTGDNVLVTNGVGGLFEAEIENENEKKCELKLLGEVKEDNVLPKITLAIAPTKNMSRLEWAVEKAVEIGVSEVIPIFCDHSERKHLKKERLEKIVIAAGKQSRKAFFPTIANPIKLDSLLKESDQQHKLFAHCEEGNKNFVTYKFEGQDTLLFIGPEGDFSVREIEMAKETNCKLVHLGSQRLRTETAAIFAISSLMSAFNSK